MNQKIIERFKQFVAPTYGRFPITLDRGEGAYVWDTDGKRYLDLGGRDRGELPWPRKRRDRSNARGAVGQADALH